MINPKKVDRGKTSDRIETELRMGTGSKLLLRIAKILGVEVATVPQVCPHTCCGHPCPQFSRPYFGPAQVRCIHQLKRRRWYQSRYGSGGGTPFFVLRGPYYKEQHWWVDVRFVRSEHIIAKSLEDVGVVPYPDGSWSTSKHWVAFTIDSWHLAGSCCHHCQYCCCQQHCCHVPEESGEVDPERVDQEETRRRIEDALRKKATVDDLVEIAEILGVEVALVPQMPWVCCGCYDPSRPYFGPDQVLYPCQLRKGLSYVRHSGSSYSIPFVVVRGPYPSRTEGGMQCWKIDVRHVYNGVLDKNIEEIVLEYAGVLPFREGDRRFWDKGNWIAFADESRHLAGSCCHHHCQYHCHHCCQYLGSGGERPDFGPDQVRRPDQIKEGLTYEERWYEWRCTTKSVPFVVVREPYYDPQLQNWVIDVRYILEGRQSEYTSRVYLRDVNILPYSNGNWCTYHWIAFTDESRHLACDCRHHCCEHPGPGGKRPDFGSDQVRCPCQLKKGLRYACCRGSGYSVAFVVVREPYLDRKEGRTQCWRIDVRYVHEGGLERSTNKIFLEDVGILPYRAGGREWWNQYGWLAFTGDSRHLAGSCCQHHCHHHGYHCHSCCCD